MKLCFQNIIIFSLLLIQFNVAIAQEEFSIWLDALKYEAKSIGVSDKVTAATVRHVQFLPDVIALDRSQPEFISPFLSYYHKRVDVNKIQYGRELLNKYDVLLSQIEAQYDVPKAILLAFWGMETQYGRYQGNVDTLSALATLAYEGRRAEFFRAQLLDAMLMIEVGHVNLEEFQGSWAGAFGNMQFMPTTFMLYAVDGDQDNKIDVVNSLPDAFASAANYLSQVGWRKSEPVMVEVQLPKDFAWHEAQLAVKKSTEEWARLGVRVLRAEVNWSDSYSLKADQQNKLAVIKNTTQVKVKKSRVKVANNRGAAVRQPIYTSQAKINNDAVTFGTELPNVRGSASILLPQGWQGPAFMVFDNFDVIMDWNRSVNYALSVAQLAKRLNQESHIIGGQAAEADALSFEQMFELQKALNARGFDAGEPDGLPGLKTQAAVRTYQLSRQLNADGYASPSLYRRFVLQQ
jgi:membrane-bound lytic murein transglycosylase B